MPYNVALEKHIKPFGFLLTRLNLLVLLLVQVSQHCSTSSQLDSVLGIELATLEQ